MTGDMVVGPSSDPRMTDIRLFRLDRNDPIQVGIIFLHLQHQPVHRYKIGFHGGSGIIESVPASLGVILLIRYLSKFRSFRSALPVLLKVVDTSHIARNCSSLYPTGDNQMVHPVSDNTVHQDARHPGWLIFWNVYPQLPGASGSSAGPLATINA